MDNIDLRKNIKHSSEFAPFLPPLCMAFMLGMTVLVLLREALPAWIMSIGAGSVLTCVSLCLALLPMLGLCLIAPCGRALCAILAVFCGFAAGLLSYSYAQFELFSAAFFATSALSFAFALAVLYISDRVFTFSSKIRALLRSDKRLYVELCRAFVLVLLFVIIIVTIFAAFLFPLANR